MIKLVALNSRFTHSCLALFYVRNELEKNCHDAEVKLYQFTINDNYYEILLRLTEGRPRFIFISAAIWNSILVERLVADLRVCLPICRVVIGGPQSSVLSERLGRENCTVVVGEIEAMNREFYQDLENGQLRARYEASFFRMKERIFDYPYRDDDFKGPLRNRHIYYESSRGCPFHCTYCLSAVEKGVYHKELGVVEKELRHILAHRPKVVRFIDRTFNDRPGRALAIWKFLVAQGGDTLFHFEMAPDRFNEEMLDFLATVVPGRFQFEIGIQSTNSHSLEAVNRQVDYDKVRQIVARLAAFGNIHLHVDLILGLPYETSESFQQSFRDIFALGAHYIQMGLLKILPDTPLCQSAEEFDYLHCSEPPYAILRNRWLDHDTLRELYWFSECVEKFANNRYFVTLWNYLRRSGEDSFAFFEQLLFICKKEGFFQVAPTQEKMTTMLVELTECRDDRRRVMEILRYDWLRCGFRYLPECLEVEKDREQPEATKSRLYQALPPELEGVYRKNNRN
ncbi:MAG: DUF4080 domain-containing protein, partial [Desulforhopalus sp.]